METAAPIARWSPPTRTERQVAWLWAGCALATVALRPLWTVLGTLLPECLLHRWTGIPCPTCGSTRALTALLDADLLGALAWNPLVAAAAVVFLAGGVAAPLWVAMGGRVPRLRTPVALPIRLAVGGAVLLNWFYLLVAGV